MIAGQYIDHGATIEMRCLFDQPHIFLYDAFLDIVVGSGFYVFEQFLRVLVHIFDQLMVLLLLKLVKFPFAIVSMHSSQLLKVGLDLTVNSVQVGLYQLVLHLSLVGTVLAVLVKNVERLLAN